MLYYTRIKDIVPEFCFLMPINCGRLFSGVDSCYSQIMDIRLKVWTATIHDNQSSNTTEEFFFFFGGGGGGS